jgi:hypothetical protein
MATARRRRANRVGPARLSFPSDWRRRGRGAASLTLEERTAACRYVVAVWTRVVFAPQPTAAAMALAALPADTPRGLLDLGVRGDAAWRVVKLPGDGRVRLRAVSETPAAQVSVPAADAGPRAYQEIVVTATSVAGDSCPTGNYRDVVGPEIGDALATARVRAFDGRAVGSS